MRTSNPALNERAFEGVGYGDEPMTVQGTANKTGALLLLLVAAAFWTWTQTLQPGANVMPWVWGGSIGGLVVAIVTIFKKTWSPFTAPLYAILEGLALGAISALFNAQYPGIVVQAVLLTFGTLAVLLVAYKTGAIKVTENFRLGIIAATGGIMVVYLLTWVLGMFGVAIPFIHSNGLVGIGFSLFVVVIAALNLVLDFDFIENAAAHGAPKYMEWYGAFGLLVTLVWLYLEILRLLSKMASRD